MLPRPSLIRTSSGRMVGSRSSSVFTTLYPAISPCVSGVVPPTESLSSLRRANGEVAHLFFGLGAHVAAAAVGSLAGCALAALLAHAPLTRQVDAPQVESLERVRRGFVAARTAGRHAGVGAGGLLAGFRRA